MFKDINNTRQEQLARFGNSADSNRIAASPFNRARLAIAVASGLFLAGQPLTGFADEPEKDIKPEIVEINKLRMQRNPSSIKFVRPLVDTAQTVNVIPKDLIAQRGATTLRDVLRNVSGISMQAGEGGTPAGDQLSIRGYSARTDIFVDNVRDFGGYTRDPFNLEQVEVVKGPSSDYSGRGSTGGSINMVSKAAGMDDFTSTSLALGSDDYTRVALDVNRAIPSSNGTAARLNVLYHDQNTPGRDVVTNKRLGIAPSLAFGLDGDTQVTVSLFHMEQDNVPDYGIPWVPANNEALADYADMAPPVDFENWYGLKQRDFEKLATTMATVQFDQQFNADMRLRNVTRWGITDRDSMITAPRFLETTSTLIRRSDEKYRDQEDDIISNQTNFTWDINPGDNFEHKVLLGVEFNLENQKRYTQALTGVDSPATDLYAPTPDDAYLENYQRTGTYSDSNSTTMAAYFSDSIKLNEQWQINGGFRYDHFDLEFTPDGSPLLERTDSMLSYRAGLVYKPQQNASIYLGYGTSFNPTAEALSISTSSRQPGIADLDPEENRTLELGTKWELFNRRMLASAAIFRTEKTNARTQDPDDPNDLLVLSGEQRVQGIELGLAGQLSADIGIYAGYTYLDTEIIDSKNLAEIGKALSNSPEHSFNLWATWNARENVQFGVGSQFVDERFSNVTNTRVAPEYWVYEASATYLASPNLSFRLNIQNLTDEDYIDFVGGGHFIPGMGRLAMLSTNYSF